MNPRQFVSFFNTKTGQVTAFGILFFVGACLLTGVLYFRHTGSTIATVSTPNLEKVPEPPQKPSTWLSDKPDAGFANKHPVSSTDNTSPGQSSTPPAALPISLYHGNDQETEVSDTYAPYGRMIPCETVITIDSAKIETPIIGFVTEDVWHDGKIHHPGWRGSSRQSSGRSIPRAHRQRQQLDSGLAHHGPDERGRVAPARRSARHGAQ